MELVTNLSLRTVYLSLVYIQFTCGDITQLMMMIDNALKYIVINTVLTKMFVIVN